MCRIMSAAAIGGAGWAASAEERRKSAGAPPRSKCLNMAQLKERRFGWQEWGLRLLTVSCPRLGDQRVGLIDVHRLDHPALVAFGTAARRFDQPPGRLELGLARREDSVGGRDLARVDHRLAVEPPGAAVLAFALERRIRLEAVTDPVERGNAGGAGGEHNPLKRVDEAGPSGPGGKAKARGEVVGARDQRPGRRSDRRRLD